MGKGTRKFTRNNGYEPNDLLHYGIDHLACARHLFQLEPKTYDSAGYLSQLGIELIMKAILLFTQGYFTDTHSLKNIYNDISSLRKKWILPKKHKETIVLLDDFYNLRYPKTRAPIEIGADDWSRIEELYLALTNRLAKSLRYKMEGLNPLKKGGRVLMVKKGS
jgi:HEPN domain-containing protein